MFVQFVWAIFRKEPYYPDLEMLLHVYGSPMSEFSLEIRAADAAKLYPKARHCRYISRIQHEFLLLNLVTAVLEY